MLDAFDYYITETGSPTSFDPLDADSTENLPVARMIYLTPLEVSQNDTLVSTVLKRFSYDQQNRQIILDVNTGVKYSDNSVITPKDVILAILRMALKRPNFPLLENIVGIKKWVHLKHPLKSMPEGILLNGSTIKITLDRDLAHPLFRLCLEVFSIIPESNINLETGTLRNNRPITSGYYTLSGHNKNSYTFDLRKEYFDKSKPTKVNFHYTNLKSLDAISGLVKDNSVITGNEAQFQKTTLISLKNNFSYQTMPSNRFVGFLLNKDIRPFDKIYCRRIFSNLFRKNIRNNKEFPLTVEAGIFMPAVPGYLTESELNSNDPKFAQHLNECKTEFTKTQFSWGVHELEDKFIEKALIDLFAELGIPLPQPIKYASKKDLTKAFIENKISFLPVSSGFWPVDVSGDLKMLFTPNMHLALRDLNTDRELQHLINQIYTTDDKSGKLEDVNRYIFNNSLLNVFAHSHRFYITEKQLSLSSLSAAIIPPPPWQIALFINRKR